MSSGDVRHVIEVQAEALGPSLHTGVATSLAAALTRNAGLAHAKYPHLLPFLMRTELREFLEANPLVNGWQVGGDTRLMGQLILTCPDLNLEMRFLKERRRTYPGGVPIAGKTKARREQWEDLYLFDLPFPALSKSEPVKLLLLWDFRSAKTLDQFTLRIVHTLAPGVYGQPVPCDLVLEVKDGGSIFKHLSFPGSPQDDSLFAPPVIELDEEDDGA